MKLGSQTGSLINHIATHNQSDPLPAVGDGATLFSWSDRDAATVVYVDAKRGLVGLQSDHAKRVDSNGMSESQTYEFTPNHDAYVLMIKRNKRTGKWHTVGKNEKGNWVQTGTQGIRFGARNKYHDFSF